uniref:Uncharacterized protein n=1 Tax=Anguilla anguilla TaxID=7936 RepID=A0A0E9WZR8_ANGAN
MQHNPWEDCKIQMYNTVKNSIRHNTKGSLVFCRQYYLACGYWVQSHTPLKASCMMFSSLLCTAANIIIIRNTMRQSVANSIKFKLR